MQSNGGIHTRNTIERMAETMRSIGEGCTDRDLILTGKFSWPRRCARSARAAQIEI
nr:hypothetical protein [Sinorhizobium medicae]